MRNYFLFLAILLFSVQTRAQKTELSGIVTDSLSNESIVAASVILSSKADSVLAGFALTDNDGKFAIDKLAAGEYFLQITYMGYKNHVEYVEIKETEPTRDLGNIILRQGNTLLEEVVVMEDRIPVIVKKDTIEYNAGSFETSANAVVEDLLKQLPGVEVESDGTIKAGGKEVTKLLVDGEEFFGNNPTVASKNLPAKVVDKVQIYDEQTEEQKLSGLTMGEKEKTINLKLKEDSKKGYFGKAMAGGGTAKRFAGELNLNRFDKKNQAALISKFNNINNSGFSIHEYADFMGGFNNLFDGDDMSGGSFSFNSSIPISNGGGAADGNKTTGILGLSYARNITEKIKINSYYTFNVVDDKLISNSTRSNFISSDNNFNTTESRTDKSRYYNNNGSIKLTFEIDSTQKIKFDNKIGSSLGKAGNEKFYENSSIAKAVTDDGRNNYDYKKNSWNISSRLSYRKKFKPGRALSSSSSISYNTQADESTTVFNNVYYDEEGFVINKDSLDRIEDNLKSTISGQQKITYVEPVGKFTRWSNSYTLDAKMDRIDNDAKDKMDGNYLEVNELSRDFDFNKFYHKLDTRLEYVKDQYSLSLGTSVVNSVLEMKEKNTNVFDKPYWFVLPNARVKFTLGKGSSIRMNYRTSYRMPSFGQLQPYSNNTNPLRIYEGNPNLDPEYTHRVGLNYNMFNNFNFNNIFLNASHSITPNSIISTSEYDEFLVERISYINSTTKTSSNASLSYSTPVKFIKSRLNLRLSTRYSQSPYLINGINAARKQFSQSINTSITNKKKKNMDIKVSYNLGYNKSMDSDETRGDVVYINHHITSNISYQFPKGWSLGTGASYKLYNSSGFADDNQFVLWDAYIEKTLFKNEKGTLKLMAVDMLNQNRGVSRSANSFYTLEKNTNAIGRFALLSFSYDLSFFSGNKKE